MNVNQRITMKITNKSSTYTLCKIQVDQCSEANLQYQIYLEYIRKTENKRGKLCIMKLGTVKQILKDWKHEDNKE